jgi:hypothetical protein
MQRDLRMTGHDWKSLRRLVEGSFRARGRELGAIGILGESVGAAKHDFLVARMVWPEPEDVESGRGRLTFSASYIRRAHLAMREARLAGIVTFHTHPDADDEVGFSPYDDSQDPLLIENLLELEPSTKLISVVIGKRAMAGRVWTSPRRNLPLEHLVVVGDQLSYYALAGTSDPTPTPAATFDRGLALTPAGALHRLSTLAVAVVGASGTGSLVAELLARAGCQDLTLIDDDIARDVNLNRILYATTDDVKHRTPKVEVLKRGIERLGIGTRIQAINDNILRESAMAHLRDADVIVGCVDKAYPRKLLCDFAYQYIRPYIDVGSEIGADDAGIVSLDARTNYVAPGRWCLTCTGLVTSRELAFESLAYEERKRVIALGYSRDLLIQKPAVMDLNMRAASLGMIVLRHLLQPFLLTPLPSTITENLVTYSMLPLSVPKAANDSCRTCRCNPHLGHGDRGGRIGLSNAQLAAILGPQAD